MSTELRNQNKQKKNLLFLLFLIFCLFASIFVFLLTLRNIIHEEDVPVAAETKKFDSSLTSEEKCDAGHSNACWSLGDLALYNRDFEKAKEYSSKACELGQPMGCKNLAKVQELEIAKNNTDSKDSIYQTLKKGCRVYNDSLIDAESCEKLGDYYLIKKEILRAKQSYAQANRVGGYRGKAVLKLGMIFEKENDNDLFCPLYHAACVRGIEGGCEKSKKCDTEARIAEHGSDVEYSLSNNFLESVYQLGVLREKKGDSLQASTAYKVACELNTSNDQKTACKKWARITGLEVLLAKYEEKLKVLCTEGELRSCAQLGIFYEEDNRYDLAMNYYKGICEPGSWMRSYCWDYYRVAVMAGKVEESKKIGNALCATNPSHLCMEYARDLKKSGEETRAKKYFSFLCKEGFGQACTTSDQLKFVIKKQLQEIIP